MFFICTKNTSAIFNVLNKFSTISYNFFFIYNMFKFFYIVRLTIYNICIYTYVYVYDNIIIILLLFWLKIRL